MSSAQLLAVSLFLFLTGLATPLPLLSLCERCRQDNAYLGFLLLYPLVLVVVALVFVVLGLIRRRPVTPRSLQVATAVAAAVVAVTLALGVTRVLVPPQLDLVFVGLTVVGAIGTSAVSRSRSARLTTRRAPPGVDWR